MAAEKSDKASSTTGDDDTKKLQESLEQIEKDRRLPRRPTLILAAILSLFGSSTFGIILAGITLARPVDVVAACISRDLILFASVVSYFYIGLHIRAARREVYRLHPGPPQLHGEYLHATALLVSRLSICIWISALIAVSAMVAMSAPARGMEGAVPYLNLMICIGAVPAFIVIAATIETTAVPFATACVSKPSLLTCRVSEFVEEIAADESVSRRASVSRAQASAPAPSTLATNPAPEPAAPPPVSTTAPASITVKAVPAPAEASTAPVTPLVTPPPTYNPGGWRIEFNPGNASIDSVATLTAVATPDIAPPAATSPAHDTAPGPVITAPPASNHTTAEASSSYFTNRAVPPASRNGRPRMTSQAHFVPRSLPCQAPSTFMTGGLPSPMPVVRPQDMYHGTPLPYNNVRPCGPRSFTGPLYHDRPSTSRSFSSNMSAPQPSKLSTVQYAEDVYMPIPHANRHPLPSRLPKVYDNAASTAPASTSIMPSTITSPVVPAGPRPIVTMTETAAAQPAPQARPQTIQTPMPGGLPNPYWVLRKAQHAQRSNPPAVPTHGPSTRQPHQVNGNQSRRGVPAPYYEDVPDEGEPGYYRT